MSVGRQTGVIKLEKQRGPILEVSLEGVLFPARPGRWSELGNIDDRATERELKKTESEKKIYLQAEGAEFQKGSR